MRSSSNTATASLLFGAALLAAAAPGWAGAQEIDVTEQHRQICAKAEQRYAELYPDAPDDGAAVVKLYKYTFCPPNLTVKTGTTVRWVNVDKRTSHSVWLKGADVDESERFFPEEQWEFTFAASGDYPYLCGPHWQQEGMTGYVKVVD